jgi:hypothetical protein
MIYSTHCPGARARGGEQGDPDLYRARGAHRLCNDYASQARARRLRDQVRARVATRSAGTAGLLKLSVPRAQGGWN